MSELALKLIAENKAKHERGEDARALNLGCCGITNIPELIGELIWLEELNLGNFPLFRFNHGKWNPVGHTNSGEKNNITILPQSIKNLKQLKILNISTNDNDKMTLKDISLISHLINLEYLDLSNTSIKDVSAISNLPNLETVLLFQTNLVDIFPIKNLIETGLPVIYDKDWILYKKIILVSKTELINPPIEIAKQGNAAILKYFEEIELAKLRGQTIRLSEAKCLILGEGGAGKTSLAKKLLSTENELPPEQATTKGIDVFPHDLKLPDGTDFRLNIWDFGGQEIYHATHQFFLTKRSLYILLDDTRKDEKTVNDPSFNYWLQVAQLYGGNSPLLIVQNEKGDRSKQLDLKGMQGRFDFVKDTKATNLLTCRGLEGVWEAIEYWLKQLPHIGEEQPKAWLDIRRELERLAREEGRDHIPLEEYYRICAQHDIPERERALFLSSYLHDFGAFLHFQDHPLLRKMLVLNNQWATDGVYRVLDCEEVKQAFGRFNRQDLARIWADDRYADQHDELLALMEKFELCYKLPDERADTWLAPQLLSVLQPDALVWDETDNLQIRYEYEFMPKGLLSQHIVRMHRYIKQTDLAWKSGVVFERAGAQALVTEAWGSRNIRIRARGANSKELLTLLSEDFDKMHERLEGLKVRKMIPCNCLKCGKAAEPHFYNHEKLQRRKMDGKRTVECDLSYEDVTVTGLLDGVFAKMTKGARDLIADGEIIQALEALPETDETTLLKGQFNKAENDFLNGIISEQDFDTTKNRIIASISKMSNK
ncbi:MAG: GTPase [Bacteroidetes bacterium]|nr:GTPase [Bacteroidota bacterium]